MAPKNLKRRQDEAESSRQKKNKGKDKRQITYDTYDEAMDGGVEMEEKGERYKDGDKAQRFYEKALDLYKKAYDFEPTFDAAYNQARVLFTLSTSFFLPPTSLSYLTTSITLYRHAMTLTDNAILNMDTAYNLSQALLEFAEVIEDLHSDRDEEVRSFRAEARDMLTQVFEGQLRYLQANSSTDPGVIADNPIDPDSAVIEPGDDIEKSGTGIENAAEQDVGDGMDVDDDKEVSTTSRQTAYEEHLPTPSSLLETVALLVDTYLTLWTTATPSNLPDNAQQMAVRQLLDTAQPWVTKPKQAEIDHLEIKVLLAVDEVVWEMYKGEAAYSPATNKSLESAVIALNSLIANCDIQPPEEGSTKVEISETLIDVHFTLARRLMYLSSRADVGERGAMGQDAWYHLGEAITILNKNLETPSIGSPKTFKSNINLELSKASLERALLSGINETAKRNSGQLFENALNYAIRAGEGIGWTWLNPSKPLGNTVELPYMSGWDTEILGRTVTLQIIRICHIAITQAESGTARIGSEQRYQDTLERLLGGLKRIKGERAFGGRDVERWVDDLEEGTILEESEKSWWEKVAQELSA